MLYGSHVILYSADAEADRAFLSDVLGFASVDAGHGWLIFALPPAEVAVHPMMGEEAPTELYFMTDDLASSVALLATKGVTCSEVTEARWGSLVQVTLPSGRSVGLYQPSHPSPLTPPGG